MQLDDLGAVEVRRCQLGEAHHQHGTDREVGSDDAVAAAELRPEGLDVGVGETRRANNRVHAMHRQPRHGDPRRVGVGEIDDDLAAGIGQRSQVAGDR